MSRLLWSLLCVTHQSISSEIYLILNNDGKLEVTTSQCIVTLILILISFIISLDMTTQIVDELQMISLSKCTLISNLKKRRNCNLKPWCELWYLSTCMSIAWSNLEFRGNCQRKYTGCYNTTFFSISWIIYIIFGCHYVLSLTVHTYWLPIVCLKPWWMISYTCCIYTQIMVFIVWDYGNSFVSSESRDYSI